MESLALRPLQREGAAVAFNHVDDELGVLTGYPVSSLDIDLAEMDGETTCL